jgi:hypothetical protein
VRFSSRRRGAVVALGAALFLVLQTLAGAVALGAGPDRLDLFGNALCVTNADASGPLHDSHAKMPANCCLAGCSMFAAMLAAPDGQRGLQQPLSGEAPPGHDGAGISGERQHHPGSPRAPPLTA